MPAASPLPWLIFLCGVGMTDSLLSRLAKLMPAPEAAARVLTAVQDLVATSGHPAEWTSPGDAEALGVDEVLHSARTLREAFGGSDQARLAAALYLPAGTIPALQVLLDDVIAAASRRRARSTRWAGRHAVSNGVKALHAIVVDLLEQEGVPRSGGSRSLMVRAVDLIASEYGIRSSVREYLRPNRPCGSLMPLTVARTYRADSRPALNREDAPPSLVPGGADGLSAPAPLTSSVVRIN